MPTTPKTSPKVSPKGVSSPRIRNSSPREPSPDVNEKHYDVQPSEKSESEFQSHLPWANQADEDKGTFSKR